MLCSTFLLTFCADRKQPFLLFHHQDISILVYQFQHRMFKLTVILRLRHLHFHTWFQREVILSSNHIIYQNHTVGKQRLYLATTDSRHFPHQEIHQLSGLRHIIYSISGNAFRLWSAGIIFFTS